MAHTKWRPGIIALVLAVLLAGCGPGGSRGAPPGRPTAGGHLLIAGVYPNGRAAEGADQFIELYNPTAGAVGLAGWTIGDGTVQAAFPAGARIEGQQTLFLARSGAGFTKAMGRPATFIWGPDAGSQPALTGGAGLKLGAAGGNVVLKDRTGQPVDQLAYGAPRTPGLGGWKGSPVPAPAPGQLLARARDERTWSDAGPGQYVADTDTAADWKQGNAWVSERVLRPGQTQFGEPVFQASAVTAYTSPDNAYATVAAAIDGARQTIDLNIYDFTELAIAEKLATAARRGVRIRMVMEAGSANQLNDQERYMAKVVAEAGGQVRWIANDVSGGMPGRYVYDHAKYAVIDGHTTVIQSENLVRHGTPADPSFGNRGWGAVVDDAGLAAYMVRVFEADWSDAYGDVAAYQPGTPFGPPPAGFVPDTAPLKGDYPHPFPALTVRGPVTVTPVLAPDHALLESLGIIGLIRSARESLLVEQQYIQVHCGVFPKPNSAKGRHFLCPFDPFRQ